MERAPPYTRADCIDDIIAAAIAVFARLSDSDLQIWVFVEYLLDATVITPNLRWTILLLVLFAQIPGSRDELRRVIAGFVG